MRVTRVGADCILYDTHLSYNKALREMPAVSVIIPIFNGATSISRCIQSVLESRYPRGQMEVICIDNGSTDGTAAILRRFQPAIRVIEESRRGPAAARNAGLRAATGELVAFTDADCFVDPCWLSNIVSPLHGSPGAVGGKILPRPEAGWVEKFGEYIHDHASAIELSEPPYLITMNMASRLSLLHSVGMFEERWTRMEDCDLAYRILQTGAPITYQGDAVVYHHHRDRLPALAREGYLHGYYTAAFRRIHRRFIENYRQPIASTRATPPPRPCAQEIGWLREKICWSVFRSAKRVGMYTGRCFPPVVE